MATEACRSGKVTIKDQVVKPSRGIKAGEVVLLRVPPIVRSYKILGVLQKRVGAKLVPEFLEEITPKEELEKLELVRHSSFYYRDRGTGRPTKKERRILDKLSDHPEE